MAAGKRVYMVADKIRALVAGQLQRVADPRLSMVTITSVVPSPDLRQAKVYWVAAGDDDRKQEISDAFEAAKGFFKKGLANNLGLRFVPELLFFYDDTLDTVQQVDSLFEKIKQKREG
jgi:ribosome-binding factor A